VKFWIGVTDGDWFDFLSSLKGLDEVNFWQPGGHRLFRTLAVGELFLFKLHSPRNYIVGGGFYAHSTLLPLSLAWETFEEKNGAVSIDDMRERLEKYRRACPDPFADYTIGCVLLEQPFFFSGADWIPSPSDFSLNIVQGKTYDASTSTGKEIWDAVSLRLKSAYESSISEAPPPIGIGGPRYGKPAIVLPRLGQGSFRVLVADVYGRRCAVTGERTLPALEAVHIKPYKKSGPHRVDNGLLLRRDIHRLFDLGYVTVTLEHKFEVSRRIREDFENGRDYYALQGRRILVPDKPDLRPSREYLTYHTEQVFRG
jgi:putative restriction endonuclease